MTSWPRRAAFVVIALGSFGVSTAHAELTLCTLKALPDDGPPTITCEPPQFCSNDDECGAEGEGEAICQEIPTGGGVCRVLCSTLFGCDTDDDCNKLPVATARCVPYELSDPAAPPDGGVVRQSFCHFPLLAEQYCVPAGEERVTLESFRKCHTTVDGTLTNDYFDGDCDHDGCPNGDDGAPCDGAGTCGLVPGPRPFCERIEILPPEDAGIEEADAGVTQDEDGGVAGKDAGKPSASIDAGPAVSFRGGGGAGCSVSASRSDGSIGGFAIVGLAAVGFLRRRRR